MLELDNKDKMLLLLLQENSRAQLKILAKNIGLSIDSTKKRIEKMKNKGIIAKFSIFIDPKSLGFELVVDNKIKLNNITLEDRRKFIAYLTELNNCIELIAVSGDYDFTCVLIAENSKRLNELIYSIREKFKNIIADWKSSFNLEVYKFEKYTLK